MALARVQGAPKVTAGSVTSIAVTLPAPPSVGNAIIVLVTGRRSGGVDFHATACTDNRGNAYQLARTQLSALGGAAAIYYCPAIAVSGAPFTVTVNPAQTGATSILNVTAFEISGGGPTFALHHTSSAAAASAAPTTGSTPLVTLPEVLVAAVHMVHQAQTSITVAAVSPAWTEEYEQRSHITTTVAGEGNSRIVTAATGTTQGAAWTLSDSGTWAASLAVFGTTTTSVPDVVADLEAAAIAAITAAGLTVGTITSAASASVPVGAVISQSPVGGTVVAFGSAVNLEVSTGASAEGLIIRINATEWKFRADSMSIVSTLNGRDTLSGIIDILDGSDPPLLNQEIVIEEDGVRIFGGRINELEYRAITSDPDASKDLMVTLGANDFNAVADNRTVSNFSHPGGLTLKQALQQLVPELAAYGVTLSSTQVDGPALPSFAFTLQTVTAILDELAKLTEFVWEIDYSKVLSMWQPGTVAAPFNITDGDRKVWGDIVIRPIASDYANRIIARAGRDGHFENTFAWYSDGVGNNFPMYLHVLQHFGQVLVDTPLEQFGDGFESVGAPGSGALWEFHDGPRYTQYLSRASGPPPPGNPVGTVPYPIQFRVVQEEPVVVTADDLPGQAANGVIEKLYDHGPTVSSWWELQAIANSMLSRYSSRRYTVQYSTMEKGLRVGQSQTITIARRNLDGPYFITDVETRMVGATLLKRTVTANETELFQGSWRDTYKLWAANSGGGGGGAVTLGTTVPTSGTVVPHHVQHEPGGMDPMTVDSTAAIGSLRTLGTGANQAAPGDALALYLLRADVDQVIRSAGTRAAQPAATAVLPGTLYSVTDESNRLERSTGTAWELYAPTGGAGGVHHLTHEPGGSDALTALDAGTLTTGTLPDARLSANVARRDQANTFTQPQTLTAASPILYLTDTSQPANARHFKIWNSAQYVLFDAVDDAFTLQARPLTLSRAGAAYINTDVYEKNRTTPMGHWIDVPFSAANFTALSPMGWTVAAGQVLINRYTVIGKTLIWCCFVYGSATTGSASGQLRIALPYGTAAHIRSTMPVTYIGDVIGTTTGIIDSQGLTYAAITKTTGANFGIGSLNLSFTTMIELT